jgi:ElaB/YqjD/DUF883 family membrane-anchored ribosome-binding protein
MATHTEPDIETLQTDIEQLRADFAKLATTMRDVAASNIAKAGEKAEASAERVWIEAKRQAQQVGQKIDEGPIASALAAFGTGLILGLLLNTRRG